MPVRFAVLAWPLGERSAGAVRAAAGAGRCTRSRACRGSQQGRTGKIHGGRIARRFKGADAFRRPERFAELLEAARLAEPGIDIARVERARAAAAAVDAGAIASSAQGADIGRLVDEARLKAIRELG